MKGHNLIARLIPILLIILYTYINNELLHSNLFFSRNAQNIAEISLLKATAGDFNSDSDSIKSFETLSMGSASRDSLTISDSSDQSDSQSVSSSGSNLVDGKFNFFGFGKKLNKSKSTPDITTSKHKSRGIKKQILKMFKKGNKDTKVHSSQGDLSSFGEDNAVNKQTESSENKTVDTDDEDEEKGDQETPPNPRLEKIDSESTDLYDSGIMKIYLESQVVSSESQISKSKEILQNNKEFFKSLKKTYNEQIKGLKCEEMLIESIFSISNQVYMAKSFCQMASIKITNETGFCRNRCRLISSKECKVCKKAFSKKAKCKAISSTVDSMISILEKMIKNCMIKNYNQVDLLNSFKLYKNLTPYKCTKEQYLLLLGKFETKLFILSQRVSFINNIVKQKYICSTCTREECLSCTSMAYCPQCPGLEDISSCSNCLAAQNLQSTLMLERNQLIKESRKLYSKLLSCESYLALTSGQSYVTVESPSESQIGKTLEEKVNLILSKYLPLASHSHFKRETTESSSGRLVYNKLPEEIKSAILSGVKLKKPSIKEGSTFEPTTQLSEAFKKLKKRKEEKLSQGLESYQIPSRPPVESTDQEKKAAVTLFEAGICTYLMIHLLEQQLKDCNSEIDSKSRQHTGCENCILDGCRKKKCSNIPEVKALIYKREQIYKELKKCNELGFLSQSELRAKIDDLRKSGLLSAESSGSSAMQSKVEVEVEVEAEVEAEAEAEVEAETDPDDKDGEKVYSTRL